VEGGEDIILIMDIAAFSPKEASDRDLDRGKEALQEVLGDCTIIMDILGVLPEDMDPRVRALVHQVEEAMLEVGLEIRVVVEEAGEVGPQASAEQAAWEGALVDHRAGKLPRLAGN